MAKVNFEFKTIVILEYLRIAEGCLVVENKKGPKAVRKPIDYDKAV